MNIEQAKEEIERTLQAYLEKDEQGYYVFPPVRQRPILLIGPPGIGKTAIMSEIADKMDVALVSYTMTHHTRQSAVGLPKITEEEYMGETFFVTTYTQSEIIASVYEAMKRTGKKEGILFLDEINCVSETLAPTMLQFLQNKTFGSHRLPDGWLIVAAGNPPEYNKSVREFDIVTLDRVRTIKVNEDVESFLRYAQANGLHGAVISYLSQKSEKFYLAKRKDGELKFVTARGWEDLSRLLQSYETNQMPVSSELIGEFLCEEETCRDFYAYYRLYKKYDQDYEIPSVLRNSCMQRDEKCRMGNNADFFERCTVVELILHELRKTALRYQASDRFAVRLHEVLKDCLRSEKTAETFAKERRSALETKCRFHLISFEDELVMRKVLDRFDEMALLTAMNRSSKEETFTEEFEKDKKIRTALAEELGGMLDEAFRLIEDSFGDGQELLLFITRMSSDDTLMRFIAQFGCRRYLEFSDRLMYRETERKLTQ